MSDTDQAVEIRVAEKTDIDIISRLAHEVWPATYASILNEAQLHHMLDLFYSHSSLEEQFNQHHVFLIACILGNPSGFASYSHGHAAGTYKVHKLYVHPDMQGKGIGRKLLDQITMNVKLSGAKVLQLNVNRHNPAKAFYEYYGFHITGEEDIAIGEGYFMNDYTMEKAI